MSHGLVVFVAGVIAGLAIAFIFPKFLSWLKSIVQWFKNLGSKPAVKP